MSVDTGVRSPVRSLHGARVDPSLNVLSMNRVGKEPKAVREALQRD
jgi:hypothetical protein